MREFVVVVVVVGMDEGEMEGDVIGGGIGQGGSQVEKEVVVTNNNGNEIVWQNID